MNSFMIVIDSSCDLPAEYTQEHGIEVLPMPFQIDGKEHLSGYWQEISGKDYYDALRNGSVATTTLINTGTFIKTFTEYARQGKDVVFLVLSSQLSSTYNNAFMALQEVKETYPDCNIFIIDSVSATSGHGLLAMLAVKKRAEGLSAKETAAWLEEKKHRCLGFFTVEDLMYLHRGGRLSRASAIAGSILGVKPILNLAPDGSLQLKDKVRGRKAAMEKLLNEMKQSLNPDIQLDTLLINHTDCLEDAQRLARMVEDAVNVRQVIVMMMGPIIGAHLGPGALTLVFEGSMSRSEYENKFSS